MTIETLDIENATIEEIREAAEQYGYNVASWQNIPDIGDKLPLDVDWQGVGTVETVNDQREALEMMAHAGEENNRQFSPAEEWINALNNRPDSDEAWEIVDEAIHAGILRNIEERV